MMDSTDIARVAAEAATPDYTAISIAANVIIENLGDGAIIDVNAAAKQVCDAAGVPVAGSEGITVGPDTGELEVRAAPIVQYARLLHATRLAVARLMAQGLIVPAVHDQPQRQGTVLHSSYYIGTSMSNTRGGFQIPVGEVHIPQSFRLTPGVSAIGDVPLLTVEKWVSDVEPLVNSRLQRLLGESLSAARHGAYLSAVTMLGAVLEGAWYAAGEELRSRDTALAKALDADRTATVQSRVADIIRRQQLPRMKGVADNLESFAGYVRMVRNYGIHTGAADDLAAEEAFTEQGSYSLIQRAHSHLVQLLAAVRKVDPAIFPS
ncbi:hypothetical protein [Nocardia asteroides]